MKYKEWYDAMDEEIEALKSNKTWELVNLPNVKEVVELKWIYKIKYCPNGLIQKYKSKLVIKD